MAVFYNQYRFSIDKSIVRLLKGLYPGECTLPDVGYLDTMGAR